MSFGVMDLSSRCACVGVAVIDAELDQNQIRILGEHVAIITPVSEIRTGAGDAGIDEINCSLRILLLQPIHDKGDIAFFLTAKFLVGEFMFLISWLFLIGTLRFARKYVVYLFHVELGRAVIFVNAVLLLFDVSKLSIAPTGNIRYRIESINQSLQTRIKFIKSFWSIAVAPGVVGEWTICRGDPLDAAKFINNVRLSSVFALKFGEVAEYGFTFFGQEELSKFLGILRVIMACPKVGLNVEITAGVIHRTRRIKHFA